MVLYEWVLMAHTWRTHGALADNKQQLLRASGNSQFSLTFCFNYCYLLLSVVSCWSS